MYSIRRPSSLLTMVVSLAAIAVLSLAVGVTEAHADDDDSDSDDDTIVLSVDVDEGSFRGPAEGTQGAFNVEGDTGSGAQTFQCWGWIFEDLTANVSQVYNIAGRGAIMTQGEEGGVLAIVGGTGDFSEAEGEALQVFTGSGFDFTITFTLDD